MNEINFITYTYFTWEKITISFKKRNNYAFLGMHAAIAPDQVEHSSREHISN